MDPLAGLSPYFLIAGLSLGATAFLKQLLQIWVKPDNPYHDSAVQAIPFLCAFGLTVLASSQGTPGIPGFGQALALLGLSALLGTGSIGSYHVALNTAAVFGAAQSRIMRAAMTIPLPLTQPAPAPDPPKLP